MPGPATARRRGGIVLAAIMLVAGCAPQPPRPAAGPPPAAQAAQAQWLAGEDAAAAQAWEALAAQASGAEAERYRVRAARAWLASGAPERARAVAATPPGDPVARAHWLLLRAELAWRDGDGAAALAALDGLDRRQLDRRSARQAAELEAAALEAAGRPLEAARVRADLDPLLDDADSVRANADALWRLLGEVPMSELHSAQRDADPLWRGWLELALLARSELLDAARLMSALEQWRGRHPGHPAAATILPRLAALGERLGRPPAQVALLLPLDGPFAAAARAVRDGVLAAWYATPVERRARLRIYPVTPASVAARAAEAVADGAELIIGPLQRESVDAVLAATGIEVPVLTLNRADTAGLRGPAGGDESAPVPRYQFGLPPEEEASQVADRAWFDGAVRAAVLAADDPWGERVEAAYAARWAGLGGELAAAQRFQPGRELAPVVEHLLLIDASRRRARTLTALLGRPVHAEPRPRHDLDCILLAARPTAARQIRPLLDFYRAADTPVYATSHVYRGLPDPVRDRDLRAIVFGDMPWVLSPRWRESDLQRALLESWSGDPAPVLRLFALGIDAWQMVPELARLRLQPAARLEGATGSLSVDDDGVVHRRLTWARFVDGLPHLLEQ